MDVSYYIDANKYPSYEEACDIINMTIDDIDRIDVIAEYDQTNHRWLESIYKSKFDVELTKNIGKRIYDSGGITAMMMNYYAFQYVSPFRKSENEYIRNFSKRLDYLWTGVGEWGIQ